MLTLILAILTGYLFRKEVDFAPILILLLVLAMALDALVILPMILASFK